MQRFHRHLVLATVLYSFAVVSTAPAQENLDLQTIIDAVEFYDTSITTISGNYTIGIIPEPGQKQSPDTIVMEDLVWERSFVMEVPRGWLWYDQWSTWRYSKISPTHRFRARTIHAFDGETSHTLLHTPGEHPFPSKTPANAVHELNLYQRKTDMNFGPWHLAGLRLREMDVTLAHLLKTGGAKLEGRERIDGHDCYRVAVPGRGYTCWLDPRRDFLPRRQIIERQRPASEPAKSDGPLYTITTAEFEQFSDPVHQTTRWFPTQGTIETWSNDTRPYRLLELRLNEPVTRSQFQIDPKSLPDGVRVNPDGAMSWFTGDRRDLFGERERLIHEDTKVMEGMFGLNREPDAGAPTARPVTAERPRGAWWYWLLVGGSLLLVATGAIQVVRSRLRN